jgi:hypothetical protein
MKERERKKGETNLLLRLAGSLVILLLVRRGRKVQKRLSCLAVVLHRMLKRP